MTSPSEMTFRPCRSNPAGDRILSMRNRIMIAALLLIGAKGDILAGEPPFPVSTPEKEGFSSGRLAEVSRWIRTEGHDIRSLIVLRQGRLVMEWYSGGVTRDHNHNIFSVTKSVVSTLAGIAIRENKFQGTTNPLGDLLREARRSPSESTSIDDLLTMRSGFPVARALPPVGPERTLFDRIHEAADRSREILSIELDRPPGQKFHYNNIDPHLVLAALEAVYGKAAPAIAGEKLFEPLQMENVEWLFPDRKGRVTGGYGLRMRAIDMAKLGQLFLDLGRWREDTILSENYVRQATEDRTGTGYGYYWWVAGPNQFSAQGVRGQLIEVNRLRKTVVVVTADLPPTAVKSVRKTLPSKIRDCLKNEESIDGPAAGPRMLEEELLRAAKFMAKDWDTIPLSRRPRIP